MENRKAVIVVLVAVISIVAYNWSSGVITPEEQGALVVLIVGASLWTTEAIPLVATSIMIPLLQSLLGVQSFKDALSPFFDPVVMLLLGGFLLAISVDKQGLDQYFAYQIISKLKADARIVVLVFMMTTGFLSMWISNTASTALMVTMAIRLTNQIKDSKGNFSKIMILGIAYSATAGGLSTLVGTTTCAMAAGFLKEMIGYEITFLEWMAYGLPITLVMILVTWVVLFAIFPTDVKEIPNLELEIGPLDNKQKLTLTVFALSILLWLTSKLPEPIALAIGWEGHGISSSAVAAIIGVAVLVLGLIHERDVAQAKWNTLLLIGGGLSLGSALGVSGLVVRISEYLVMLTGGRSGVLIIALVTVFGLGISIVASNTASAGVFLPIAIGLGSTTGVNPVILAVAVGISTSLDFMLPVGTPPNAIAYSTGKVEIKEMIKAGVLLDLSGAIITILLAWLLWPHII
ncbi:MAG TPA: DASS family sodium-coupled anion symporter [Patescibacteria group bacterium]|nr:DASS family sodium-coupled anion symporter [Patescibacteria group bacterium]